MKTKDIIILVLGLIIIGLLVPKEEAKQLFFKEGKLVKVIWIDGNISELKNNKWIYSKKR